MTSNFETARKNWLKAKENYDQAVKMYETVSKTLELSHQTLNEAWDEFYEQQKLMYQFFKDDNVVNMPTKKDE